MNWHFLHGLTTSLINSIILVFLAAYWYNYKYFNFARYEIDTNYLLWTTPLPAFTVCQAGNFNKSGFNLTNKPAKAFFNGLIQPKERFCESCENLTSQDLTTFSVNFSELVREALAPCDKLFKQCLWNGMVFQCCERFRQARTEHGICYSLNSDQSTDNVKLLVSHFAKRAKLEISVASPTQIFIHDPKDISFRSAKAPVVRRTSSLELHYMVQHITSHRSARELSLEQRGCVLPDEGVAIGYKAYSESTCSMRCEKQRQLNRCGCFHHLFPTDSKRQCDLTGLQCLDKYFINQTARKDKDSSVDTKSCGCLPACDRTRVKIVWGRLYPNTAESSIVLVLTSPPKDRMVLRAKLEFLDAFVGFACLSRLFTSFNLLSVYSLVFKL